MFCLIFCLSLFVCYRNASAAVSSMNASDVIISNVVCNGSESDLGECMSGPWNSTSCGSGNIVTVNCRVPGLKQLFFPVNLKYLFIYIFIFYDCPTFTKCTANLPLFDSVSNLFCVQFWRTKNIFQEESQYWVLID